jgi:hypothetical protein
MEFSGIELESVLQNQTRAVEVYRADGTFQGQIEAGAALKLACAGGFIGVGNGRRIRRIKPTGSGVCLFHWRGGSNTQVMRNDAGAIIPPTVGSGLEHCPISSRVSKPTPIVPVKDHERPLYRLAAAEELIRAEAEAETVEAIKVWRQRRANRVLELASSSL